MDKLLEKINQMLPNCHAALDLAERGIEQPLQMHERVKLRYHSRLCLHCSCAENKFNSTMKKMRAAEAKRKSS